MVLLCGQEASTPVLPPSARGREGCTLTHPLSITGGLFAIGKEVIPIPHSPSMGGPQKHSYCVYAYMILFKYEINEWKIEILAAQEKTWSEDQVNPRCQLMGRRGSQNCLLIFILVSRGQEG